MFALILVPLLADPGDVESSHDYPGFTRPPGFLISDFDEDNPAEFNFPVAQPLADDADHVDTVAIKGHRYVIRYELASGSPAPTLFQTQRYYEKLASDAGYKVLKSGAVGDVTETFYLATAEHHIWIYLEPAITANVLTIVESTSDATPPAPPRLVVNTATLPPPPAHAAAPTPPAATLAPPADATPTPSAQPTPMPPALQADTTPPADPQGESLYADLSSSGRVALPIAFQPGRDDLDPASQPLIDRIVAMMNHHPDLFLRIEGHTDNSGEPDDSLRLSAQRALAVQALLIAAHINKTRLDSVGVGGLQPIADNNTAEGREKNRRIELVMWKKYPAFHSTAPNGQNYYPGGN